MKKRNLAIAIILSAAVGLFAIKSGLTPVDEKSVVTNTDIAELISTDTLTPSPAYEGCAYMWAYHDSPELTEKVDTAIRAIDPEASATAELFGEDCVYEDGSSTFSTMETDFYVQLPVDDLKDEEAFGNWMAQVLSTIVQIPEDEIQGNYGFVEFSFIKSDIERLIFRAPIATYITEAKEKTGAELFRFFYTPPVNPT
ncbi:MAG: hypothetical protein H7Y59_00220 [Anaerolineales bacterium]|nr:hypothetical protein [Anaerolineales bacterium]